MNEPLFLTPGEVLQLHAYQIQMFGGDPAVRDTGLLESAVAQPQCSWHYQQADLAAIAAAYLYHIVQNHPFADGNKRTGAHAAIAFLWMNNIEIDYPVDEAERLTIRVAAGQATKEDVIRFFQVLLANASSGNE